MRLYLKKRKGFIKLALRFGVDIVPTFSFNEQFIYNQILAEKGNVLLVYHLVVSLSTDDYQIKHKFRISFSVKSRFQADEILQFC